MNALAADMTTATWENSQKVFRTWTKTQLLHAGAVLDIAVCLVATLCQIMSFRAQWTDCVASCRRELTDCGCQWREALKNRPLFSSNVRGGGGIISRCDHFNLGSANKLWHGARWVWGQSQMAGRCVSRDVSLERGCAGTPPPSCQKQLRTRSRGLLNLYVETSHRLSLSLFQCNEINN